MAARQVNLTKVFQSVTEALASNQEALNKADTFNHNHGDNMVEVFEVVTQAMKARRGASAADQLAYASELLRQRESGSARYYAGGLSQAARRFEGQGVTTDNVMQLVQTLISGGQERSPVPSATGTDALAALLGGMGGGGQEGAQPSIDIGSLLNAGLSYLSAKESGQSNMEALMGALMAGTQGGSVPYRAQSGALVANALLRALGGLTGRR